MINELFDLSGKVALVSGATRGLGEAAAGALAKAGAVVAVCGRSQPNLKQATGDIQAKEAKLQGSAFHWEAVELNCYYRNKGGLYG
jgi:NAD(P)-dependent dehydrogenase (short-subunit alcohol dehydrogenase family)